MAETIAAPEALALGESLPVGDPHGVSVQLPTWADTVGWASREPRVINAMVTGYPRFFIPRIVDKLGEKLLQQYAKDTGFSVEGKRTLLVASRRHALLCQQFLAQEKPGTETAQCRVLRAKLDGQISLVTTRDCSGTTPSCPGKEDIFLIAYPAERFPTAKAFWQHTGFGISSRRATYWLENTLFLRALANGTANGTAKGIANGIANGNGDANGTTNGVANGTANGTTNGTTKSPVDRKAQADIREIKTRISALLSVPRDAVYLYPAGMAAIAETAVAIQSIQGKNRNSPCVAAVFGFLYVDTYKVITRILGYSATLYKYSTPDIDALEAQLGLGYRLDALFTEFPGNPLLQTPDLPRLHRLSRLYNFILVVDDTISSGNTNVLHSCDVVCTSLTKMFSGACNAMGGSVVVSPHSRFHEQLHTALRHTQRDNLWFPQDISVMEQNSRDFVSRVRRASRNAEVIVEQQLRRHSSVEEVYYPKKSPTQELFDKYRLKTETETENGNGNGHGGRGGGGHGGYGFLLSIRFVSPQKAVAFYDALATAKGPSLGTNFTLTCAYTLLAHYSELEWAAEYGVVEDLVRISVGLEDEEWLRDRIDKALKAAESVEN